MVTTSEVLERLSTVMDPCSVATKVPTSVVDMGLVRSVDVDDGHVLVVIGVTTPMCHMIDYFMQQVDQALTGLSDVSQVTCQIDQTPGWTYEEMTPAARERLAARFGRLNDGS